MTAAIDWIDASTFEVRGVRFHLDLSRDRPLTGERVVLMKDRPLVDAYARILATYPAKRILELGIWGGGSTILLERLFSPVRLVTVERTATRPEALRAHVEARALHSVIHEHYEVWQQQTSKLLAIAESEFGEDGIDLVVDDASHLLEPTRACFNVLFPRVRPGGWYLLEDWAWAHWPGSYQQGDWLERQPLSELILELVLVAASHRDVVERQPLSELILELVLVAASHRDVVASMQLEYGLVAVQRGAASLGPDFDVSASYRARGKRVGWV